MYKKYSPENNAEISDLIKSKIDQGEFAPITILNMLSILIPTYYVPGLIEGLNVSDEHFMGFKAALTFAIAAMWSSSGSDLNAKLAFMQSGTTEIRNNGSVYLSRGKQAFLKDKTGKSLLSDVVEYIRGHFSNPNFVEGAKAAQTVYSAYLKKYS